MRKDLFNVEEIALPLFGEQQGAVAAAKQLQAKEILKRLDLVADGGLGDKQLICRAGKAQVAGRSIKYT